MAFDPLSKAGLKESDLPVEVTETDRRRMHAFTPLEGRYARYVYDKLTKITSEYQNVKRRLEVEIEYMIGLGDEFANYEGTRKKLIERPFGNREREALRGVYQNFSDLDFKRFQKIEKNTEHDVVALCILGLYKMGDVVDPELMERAMHFGRTSSDMDSNVFSLVVHDIMDQFYLPELVSVQEMFIGKAEEWHGVPKEYGRPFTVIQGQTHEKFAVPTPIKKVMANFVDAIDDGLSGFLDGRRRVKLCGKIGGAVGNDSAMCAAYPDHDWEPFYRRFIEGMGLKYQPMTDQDESNMRVIDLLGKIKNVNIPLLKWCNDYSSYMSRGVLTKKTSKTHRGSSIMPQKINPWRTEGADAALLIANAEIGVFDQLGKQRKQGDLTRSYIKRYVSVPFANIGIAFERIKADLGPSFPDHAIIGKELREHPETAAASVQMILRREGITGAYDLMVEKTKGVDVTPEKMNSVIDGLVSDRAITKTVGKDIKNVFLAENNMGSSLRKADESLEEARGTIRKIRKAYDL